VDLILRLQGNTPLLLNNVRLASPLNPYAKKLKELQGKPSRQRTDSDHNQIARVYWEGAMYYEQDHGPGLTAFMVFRSLQDGARRSRKGTHVQRGVIMHDMFLPLQYEGPRDLDRLWEQSFYHMALVRVGNGRQAARVERYRPCFREWAVETTVTLDESELDLHEFEEIANAAGRAGIGDFRPFFGRYEATVKVAESTI
jgi:hypothetical protein